MAEHPVHIGCSGWNYRDWRERVYPVGLPARRWLQYYATLFDTVEVNTTFYRLPKREAVERWAQETPAGFAFAVKVSRYVTHIKRLREARQHLDLLLARIEPLTAAGKLGPLLWQLPPTFKRDDQRLADALGELPRTLRHAFEFRHESWFDDEVYDALRARGTALCIADAEDLPKAELIGTASFGYVRLRRKNYTKKQLAVWLSKIQAQNWEEVYVFFKHEETGTGPKFAARFLELAGDQALTKSK